MRILNLHDANNVEELTLPSDNQDINLESSALLVLTDFQKIKPLVIESDALILELKNIMRKAHVRMKLVINSDNKFVGIISASNIIDRKIIQKVAEGHKRDKLIVSDLMRDKSRLKTLKYNDILKSTIGDVMQALESEKAQHCLIVDKDNNKIRGVISTSDIARKLQIDIDITSDSYFSKLYKKLY